MILQITISILLIMTVLFMLPLLRSLRASANNGTKALELQSAKLVFASAAEAKHTLVEGKTTVSDIKGILDSCKELQDL